MKRAFSNKFTKKYPYPTDVGVKSLFRFSTYSAEDHDRHKSLLTGANLFHNLPNNFNDPFECRPKIVWPTTNKQMSGFRQDLETLLLVGGKTAKASYEIAKNCKITDELKSNFEKQFFDDFQAFRICSFTDSKFNLLFWSHYASSHTGYCVEFSTRSKVIEQAYKVNYSKRLPKTTFPMFGDLRILYNALKEHPNLSRLDVSKLNMYPKSLLPLLNKSKEWSYESEFRSIFKPNAPMQFESDDNKSLLLPKEAITDIYFGVNMKDRHKKAIVRLADTGPFTPTFWVAKMKQGKYALSFEEY